MQPLLIRRSAAQACLDRFAGQAFAWGRSDCARLAAFALRGLGHNPRLARFGTYSTAIGARRALKRAGFDTIEAALDGMGLPRIPPAAALPGDIIALPSADDEAWPALCVALGGGRVLGFHGEVGLAVVMQPEVWGLAWRVDPKTPRGRRREGLAPAMARPGRARL